MGKKWTKRIKLFLKITLITTMKNQKTSPPSVLWTQEEGPELVGIG